MSVVFQEIHKACGTPLRRRLIGMPSHVSVIVYCPKCDKKLYSIDFDITADEYKKFTIPEVREKIIGDAIKGKRAAILKNLEDVL